MIQLKTIKISWLMTLFIGLFTVAAFAAPVSDSNKEENKYPYFTAVEGVITEVRPQQAGSDNYWVSITTDKGGPANLVVGKDTFFDKGVKEKLEPGQKVTAFYKSGIPMLMIYPPQIPISLITIPEEHQFVIADVFDKQGINTTRQLQIKPSSSTKIVLEDGSDFRGSLENRKLIVYYGVTTKSIPAQAVPDRIVVLFEKAVPPIHKLTPEEKVALYPDVAGLPIVVENTKLADVSAYNRADGTVMIPARVTLEKLGYKVSWDPEREEVLVNGGISSFKIGSEQYTFGKMAPIQLEAAPELKNGITYVPLSYFQEVLKINNAYIFEGQIVLDNGEKMN